MAIDDKKRLIGADEPGRSRGLFAEEDMSFRHARRLFEQGPDKVMLDMQGGAKPYDAAGMHLVDRLKNHDVYIRDDGWMLAAIRKWTDIAAQLWATNWVGKITIGFAWHRIEGSEELCYHRGKHSQLFIFPENRTIYSAGVLDENGVLVNLEEQEEAKASDSKKSNNFTNLQDFRDWVRKGCPE